MQSDGLSKITGYTFKNKELLESALRRTAYARETGFSIEDTMDYLAVLGDAILDVITIEQIIAEGEHDKGLPTRNDDEPEN